MRIKEQKTRLKLQEHDDDDDDDDEILENYYYYYYYYYYCYHLISHFSGLAGKYSPLLGFSNQQD